MIDVHAHLFFDELLGLAGDLGPRIVPGPDGTTLVTGGHTWPMGTRESLTVAAQDRLTALDEDGIDVQVLSISPLWLFHHAPAGIAQRFARTANETLARWCSVHTDRLKGLAQLPTQHIGHAIAELEHAVTELGLVGGYIGTDCRARLDDPELDELYSACEELDVPLFLHGTVPGVDGPPGDERLRRRLGDVVLGYPIEETIACASLLLGGVTSRHPKLDLCISHGGGALPYLYGRLRRYAETGAAPVTAEDLDQALSRLWFDTHVHSAESELLLQVVGNPNRLVFGSNHGGWDAEVPTERSAPATANAARLLRL